MTSKKVVVSVAYLAVFGLLATYLANDFGWLKAGPVYWGVLYGAAIVLLGAVLLTVVQRSSTGEPYGGTRNRGTEKPFLAIALIAVLALAVVEIARAAGYLVDRNLFTTLNIVLPILFFSMTYQIYLRRRGSGTLR